MAAYSSKKKKKNSNHLYSLFHHSDHDHFHQAIPSTDDHLFVMELEESDVVWGQDDEPSDASLSSSSSSSRHRACSGVNAPALTSSRKKKKKPKEAAVSASLPVNVPDWPRARRLGGIVEEEEEGDEEGDAVVTAERLPPHEYLARRRGDSFSVQEGIGRTLKGMELCRVRNEILKKLVGFED